MTESTEITSKEENTVDIKSNKSSPAWRKVLFLLIALLFLSIILVVFRTQSLINLQNIKLNDSITQLRIQQTKANNLTSTEISSLTKNLEERITNLDQKISKSLEETAYKSNDWIMQKAKYYLELANINNNWTDDLDTTKKLLIAADNTLKDINKDEITEVRNLIAEEELRINSVNKIDKIKLLAEIHAINKALLEIPIIPLKDKITVDNIPKDTEANISNNWHDNFKNSIKRLNSLIIIRKNTTKEADILSPSYLATIRETLKLNLQQMQWAILERNQDIYNLSCQQAIENINYALEDTNLQKKAILKKLNKLNSIDLTLTKTKIGDSLLELNKIIKENENINQG